jgi:hypothetical protein
MVRRQSSEGRLNATSRTWRIASLAYVAALATFATGVGISSLKYPDQPYDWQYVVMSDLASRKHNPEGGRWFGAMIGLSMLALWPVVTQLRDTAAALPAAGASAWARGWPIVALRAAILCGVAIGLERVVFTHLSDVVPKAHELLALLLFVGLYAGVLGLYFNRVRDDRRAWAAAVIVAAPLAAIGILQFALYLDPRDLGWPDPGWRTAGIPAWWSFAFWQWLAVAALWIGLGHLLWSRRSGPD